MGGKATKPLEDEGTLDTVSELSSFEETAIEGEDRTESEESRVSSGSEIDSIDNVDVLYPLPPSELPDTVFSSESLESMVSEYLGAPPAEESIDPEHFSRLKSLILTPRELFERDYGPEPDEDTVEVIQPIETKAPPPRRPPSEGSDLMTDLSDDEDGWPKYDMNALMEEAEAKGVTYQNPLIPTIEDYVRDKGTCGQKVLNHYDFSEVFTRSDKSTHLEAHGPDGTRVQDFWTQCHKDRVGLISMFGEFVEDGQINCARYIPEDQMEKFLCGKIVVRRLSDPDYPFEHCKVQKFAVRPEELGWHSVWHCQRALQPDPAGDYSIQNKEFEELKTLLLRDTKSKQWLQHGPMQFSGLRQKVPGILNQKTDFNRMSHPYYHRDYMEDEFPSYSDSISSMES
uniref:Tyrosine-protein phosphatase domain-containing protein n=1 Tax=Caenorhabditis tropicalis TaxID=1561998 RepID=A0A1I7T2U5_9PELO